MYTPDFDTFRVLAEQGNLVPVYREILADLETPVSAFLKIDEGGDAFLLESVARAHPRRRRPACRLRDGMREGRTIDRPAAAAHRGASLNRRARARTHQFKHDPGAVRGDRTAGKGVHRGGRRHPGRLGAALPMS